MRVLLAIDGSKESFAGVKFLARLPFRVKPKVTLLTVLSNSQVDLFAIENGIQLREQEQETADKNIQTAKKILNAAGYDTEQTIARGHPNRLILDTARQNDVDLIVLGARGHFAAYRVLLGSTADFVANHAKCSVLVVRPPSEESLKAADGTELSVLVAYEGSAPSKLAYAQMSEFDWPKSTRIHVNTMLERPVLLPEEIVYDPETIAKSESSLLDLCSSLSSKCNVTHSIREALHVPNAVRSLADEKESDLLFVGDTGKSAISRFFLGSTSRFLLHHARCSIWIARKKEWE